MKIFWLKIWKYKYDEFLDEICMYLSNPSPLRGASFEKGSSGPWGGRWKAIFTPNPEICLKTLEDDEFLQVLQSADYLTSDGIWLYLAFQIRDFLSLWKREYPKGEGFFKILWVILLPYYIFNILFRKKFLYKKYGERICGSDLTNSLLKYCQENNIKIAILDPYYPQDVLKCESQKCFREKLSVKFPDLDFDFYIYSQESSDEIFEKIDISGAKILFSTLGMKKQELAVMQWLELCPNLKLWLGIGSAFDYHTWFQQRAPKIFRELGFEWFYRIFTSPNKLQRLGRIFQALVVFPVKVIVYKK